MGERAPWWLWFLAATFVLYGAFIVYCNRFGPEAVGANFDFASDRMILLRIAPGGPAERAGLRPGDALLRVDGIRTRNYFSWVAVRAQVEIGKPQAVEAERDGKPLSARLVSTRRTRQGIVPNSVFPVIMALKVLGFGLVFLILWQRPRDKVALLAAWLVACVVSAAGLFGTGTAVVLRHLPAAVALLLVFPFFCNVAGMAGIMFTFCAMFPRRLFRSLWPYAAAWALVLVMFMVSFPDWYRIAYQPQALRDGIPNWSIPTTIPLFLVFAAGALLVLAANYRRLDDVNERRRVRVVVAGLAVSWIVSIPGLFALNMGANHPIARPYIHPVLGPLLIIVSFTFPCALTYAVLRHRIFDVRVIVRQGLQYAVARRALLAAVPVLALLLLMDLLAHGQNTIAEILRSRGWVYGALAALALLAHSKRQAWLDALDRRFFRDRYDAQMLLRSIVDDLRAASSFERASAQVSAKVETALHAEFAAVYVKEAGESLFTAIAASPASSAPPQLVANAKFIGMIRLLEAPLRIAPASEWGQNLPAAESALLLEYRLDVLMPIAMAGGKREAMLALGPKRSEEPYSREDLELLGSTASSLALLLERPQVAVGAEEAFLECPECGRCYEPGASACSQHACSLVKVRAPRLLAGRYRLDRRIGRGGMGAVYAARDTALERDVAAKLIVEELIGSTNAAQRFRREAQAAAAFSHANVVTVFDYGLAGSRAFLIMELLHGCSLRKEIQRAGRLSPERVLEVFRGICAAVEAGHRRGLIHRDLKPENIFLARNEDGEVAKILDFGLVKTVTEDTQATRDTTAGVVVGTAPYMGPEQMRGCAPTPAFDLWALAVVLYESLTGRLPFPVEGSPQWREAMFAGRFTPVAVHLPWAPESWKEFFTRSLAPEPERRPQSATGIFTELERALATRTAALSSK
ncbi:MAG: protein kinase [Acidobacteriia bacterium]|nr:protein kinase [Terriglobia bacterium]